MFVDVINELYIRKQGELNDMNEELDSMRGGMLNIRQKGDAYFYVERSGGKQKGITRDRHRVQQLARKMILLENINISEKELKIIAEACAKLDKIDKSRIGKIRNKLAVIGSTDFNFNNEELQWIQNKNSHNPYNREFLRYKTYDGVMTRSKSERFIGNFLEEKNLIYMYEPELVINGRLIYPDFMILCPNGRVVIWEHCGLMDQEDYYNKMNKRISEYRKGGYVQHDNLICTYEEDLDSIETLESIYRRFLR